MAADLLVPWKQAKGAARWFASFQTRGPVLLLTAFMGPDSLWYGLVEQKYTFGPDWKSASPFANRELAQEWAEGQAEKLREWR